jgi:NAD(P)-dependent dehydrogenase (short-subunit alcohol dehydrogenase family)
MSLPFRRLSEARSTYSAFHLYRYALHSLPTEITLSFTHYNTCIPISLKLRTTLQSEIASINTQTTMADVPSTPPSRGLKGKVAIITGAGCHGDGIGNGRAISIILADEGCNVVCLDLNLEWAQKTAQMCMSQPHRGKAIALKSDVTNGPDCEAAVQLVLKAFGKLDILVNNVGIGGASGTAVDVDMEAWAKGLEINVTSMVKMAKYAVPAMQINKEGVEGKGVIVNMGSVAGLKGGTPHLLYPTSKGAVVNMTRAMAAHHAGEGIRVNCVCPGVCCTFA